MSRKIRCSYFLQPHSYLRKPNTYNTILKSSDNKLVLKFLYLQKQFALMMQ